ncbi:iron complex outermembrane receptor protein [Sinobacterium caligoides]|uniref:Iron complex outermembrane receptor protein n=1 Tax=Sinobacterium caligoides TaxID=933926 RepID=A0A3N2DP05_9GAMM|nr:TonB-dependent receptor [Sinobacterium caligoides]ROS01432.1 iron complex outermembrane receptor protein [Sinobacterium caligoides]
MSNKIRNMVRVVNRHGLLSKSVAMCALMSMTNGVMAQADAETADAGTLEEVVVTGIRGSLQESLETKRNATSIVDAINAEDLGKFPDKNVADSLARITGVSITRGFGEGEKIAVRGTSPNQNRTLLNGHAVASADWFVLDTPSRAFNYSLLPSAIVSSLEVYKTPQAQIQEGSIGGTTYIRTRKPLEMEANSGNINAQGQYSTESEETDPQFSGMYSWKNDDETFGLMGSYTYQERNLVRSGKEVYGFSQQEIDGQDVWAPRAMGDAYFEQQRERETYMFTAQARPSDRSEITLNYLNSSLGANNTNISNYSWFLDTKNTGADDDPKTADNEALEKGVIDGSATFSGGGVVAGTALNAYSEYYVIDRQSNSNTESINLEFDQEFDTFNMAVNVGHTNADGGTSNDRHYNFDTRAGSASFDEDLNVVRTNDGAVETTDDLLGRSVGWIQEGSRTMEDSENYAMVDFDIPAEVGVFTGFKTGVMARDHQKSQEGTSTRFHLLADGQHEGGNAGKWGVMNDNYDVEANGFPTWLSWPGQMKSQQMRDYLADGNNAPFPVVDPDAMNPDIYPAAAYAYPTITVMDPSQTWDVKERIYAAYFSGDFEIDRLSGNVGVRVVQTESESTGYQYEGDAFGAIVQQQGGYDLWVGAVGANPVDSNLREETENHSYTSILPNLNVAYDLTDDQVLRGSIARTMARPDYSRLANTHWQNTAFDGSVGNAKLDPEYANQIDASWEWYFADQSLVSAALFYKDIDGTIVNTVKDYEVIDPASNSTIMIPFTSFENGDGSSIAGLEVSYQQAFGDFGVIANYTYTDAKSKDDRDAVNNPGSGLVAGSSDHMANLTGYYENDWFSARLMYNYRTEYYAGLSDFGSEEYINDYGQVDMSASIYIPGVEGLSVTLEGVNILEESLDMYHIDKDRKSSEYDNGARWLLGVNYTF